MLKQFFNRILALCMCLCLLVGQVPPAQAAELAITSQPQSAYAEDGQKISVSVKATGDGLTYQWYLAKKGSSTFSKSSIASATYSTTMSDSVNGRQVYCIVTDASGSSIKSQTAILNLKTPLKITTQPKSVTVAEGETAKVSLAAQGNGLKYTWYFKDAGASSFSKTSSFTGTTYSVEMTAARAGRQVYCVVSDLHGNTVKSNVATLNMAASLKITSQPKSVAVASGETATVSLTAQGDGLTYTWYFKSPSASSFTKTTSFTSNTSNFFALFHNI